MVTDAGTRKSQTHFLDVKNFRKGTDFFAIYQIFHTKKTKNHSVEAKEPTAMPN